jgi:EAL and modified HD-GYP domain-containing signal transduction protein
MPGQQFFLGRQPILGRKRNLVAYELLFRASNVNQADVLDDIAASMAVIRYAFSDLGLQSAIGNKLGFINLSASLLMSDVIELLPPGRIVLEILETVEITEGVIARCRDLREAGYTIALDDVVGLSAAQRRLLPLVKIVKIDIMQMARGEIAALVDELRPAGVKLLAEKIDSQAEFEFCRSLEFDLFQGYFFAKPAILSGRAVEPSVTTLLKVFTLLANDAEIDALEAALKQSPDLTVRLLKLVNSAAFSINQRVSNVRSAIMVLGRVQLSRLVQILLLSQQSGTNANADPVVQTAVVRGHLMEAIATFLGWTQAQERAFMVGMLSLVNTLFDQPIEEVVQLLNLDDTVRAALLCHEGRLGRLLYLVEASESADGAELISLMQAIGLTDVDQFNRMQIDALQWAAGL